MSRNRTSTGAVIAWATWAAMLVAALLFVSRFGSNVPSWDDWDMIPVLTHHQPVTWDWLWSQHNEHRVPLPRLVFLRLDRLLGVDMRVTMYFDVLLIAAVAAAMITTAARLRGRASAVDAFFPMALLSLGQAQNWLWGWQLQFFASVAIACVALLAIVRVGAGMSPTRAGLVVGLCALLLPLCGANGLAMVPALAAWPLALAILPESGTGAKVARGNRVMLLAVGLLALALTAIYFVGWHRVPYHPKSPSVLQTLRTALKALTIGLGPATRGIWPLSGLLALGAMGASALLLVRVGRERAAERARAVGLLLFLLALSSLALALGMGRDGFEQRYVTLTLPAWCGVAFIWLLYGKSAGVGVPAALAGAALVAMAGNTSFGLKYARQLRGQLGGFERDMAAGVPMHDLLHRYGGWLHPHVDVPARYLPMMRQARIPGYAGLREDSIRAVPLNLHPTATAEVEWRDSTARVQGSNARLVFDLPRERFVTGLRLRYRYQSDDGNLPYIALQWKRDSQREFDHERYYKYSPTGDHANWKRGTWDTIHDSATTMTIWICDTVHQIAITPDFRPAVFRIDELSLLETKP